MIDIHSHILYGLDDGAQNLEQMIEMARQAVRDGITAIIATPHHRDGTYDNPPEVIGPKVLEANEILQKENIPLTVLPGMEIHVYGEVVEDLKQGKLMTYNNKNRHILLELPHDHVPRYLDQLVFDLQLQGYIPIIPHPERNKEIAGNLELLYRMVKRGALAQLTAASVAGKFGKKIQKCCFEMIKHHYIHFIATDAHNVGNRGFVLQEAYETIRKKFGDDYVDLFLESAEKLAEGKDCFVLPPERIRKKFLGIF